MMNFKCSFFELKEMFLLFKQNFANRRTQFKWYVLENCYMYKWNRLNMH